MRQNPPFAKIGAVAFVVTLGVGCASSDHARYHNPSVGDERVTVSALSFGPETRAGLADPFAMWDQRGEPVTIETYTFSPPGTDAYLASLGTSNVRQFDTSMRPGTAYAEAAGGGAMWESEGDADTMRFRPDTRAAWVNRFPFYDTRGELVSLDVYPGAYAPMIHEPRMTYQAPVVEPEPPRSRGPIVEATNLQYLSTPSAFAEKHLNIPAANLSFNTVEGSLRPLPPAPIYRELPSPRVALTDRFIQHSPNPTR